MNHYLYLLSFQNGKQYIGAHSTVIKPELDTLYLGSGKALPERTQVSCVKQILSVYSTREALIQAEIDFIIEHECVASPEYYNLRISTFDKHGQTAKTHPGIASMQKKLTGRKAAVYPYIQKANKKRQQYSGNHQTPAQKAGNKKMGKNQCGTKNLAKGHKGVTNQGFVPWYFITPEGEYGEVHDMTKQDFASSIGVSPRQLGHRFHFTNIDKKAKGLPLKGWTFGNLGIKRE